MAHTDPVLSTAPQVSGQVDVHGLSKTVDGLRLSVTGFLEPTAPERPLRCAVCSGWSPRPVIPRPFSNEIPGAMAGTVAIAGTRLAVRRDVS
jgi:hypothetical protein